MSLQNHSTTSWTVRPSPRPGQSSSHSRTDSFQRQQQKIKPNGHHHNTVPVNGSATKPSATKTVLSAATSAASAVMPPKLLGMYDEFITKNAGSVGQIESALRSLTYVIPGRFRDAEIASETLHSGVQLLSLYHDALLRRVAASQAANPPPPSSSSKPTETPAPMPTPHTRYTNYWISKSPMYRRVALLLQMIRYTELLCEMTAKRRGGERARWRVVVVLEVVKAVCKLILLQVTRSRPLLSPALPERETVTLSNTDDGTEEQDMEGTKAISDILGEDMTKEWAPPPDTRREWQKPWTMPRTGMSLPSLPPSSSSDISSYLLERVLTADDIKPAPQLVTPTVTSSARAAEVLHILAPLVYAILLARAKDKKRAWHPWVVGLLLEMAARHLRDRGLRTTKLERDEWIKRAWSMGWWSMRGAFYDSIMKNVVGGVRARMPRLIGGILEDYEYLWENYYFSTSCA